LGARHDQDRNHPHYRSENNLSAELKSHSNHVPWNRYNSFHAKCGERKNDRCWIAQCNTTYPTPDARRDHQKGNVTHEQEDEGPPDVEALE
jgi:hypothetical protein